MKRHVDFKNEFISMFNPETGFYVRISFDEIKTEEKDGKRLIAAKFNKNKEAFQSEFPELADICITKRCNNTCPYCYQNANSTGEHMPLENYKKVIDQLKGKAFQIAIGGGEPTCHPDFVEILKYTREAGIVPNYTTNGILFSLIKTTGVVKMDVKYGDNMVHDCIPILNASKKYCGAVAVSYHEDMEVLKNAIETMTEFGIKTNIHYIINKNNIEKVDEVLDIPNVNAVIFLLYKPVGRGNKDLVLTKEDFPRLESFIKKIKEREKPKIGFDACFCNYLIRYTDFDPSYFDSCDSGRFSVYVNQDMTVSPCSFNSENFGSLENQSFDGIWNGEKFNEYRDKLKEHSCKGKCVKFEQCYGGCPILDINLCKDDFVKGENNE